MAMITRTTLVLRGVSVLRDGLTVVMHLGSGYRADHQTPALFSMRHPLPVPTNEPEAERWSNPDDRDASSQPEGFVAGTAGAANPRTPAINAGRHALLGLPGVTGGSTVPAVRFTGLNPARNPASVDKVLSRASGRIVSCQQQQLQQVAKSTGTTSTGSTRWGLTGFRKS
jgi:hypothetical protein